MEVEGIPKLIPIVAIRERVERRKIGLSLREGTPKGGRAGISKEEEVILVSSKREEGWSKSAARE